MLKVENTALVVVDVQGKLASLMHGQEALIDNLRKLIRGAQVLELPILWNEQLPEKLGPTVPDIAALLSPAQSPLTKATFSCCGNPTFIQALHKTARSQFLLAGIEAHVCVCQTCLDLLDRNYEVFIVADAVSSRTADNRQIALDRMQAAGATLVSVEMALFELLRRADGPKFKEMLKFIK